MKTQLLFLSLLIGMLFTANSILNAQTVSTFESLPLAPDSYWDGSDTPGGASFQDGNAIFPNVYNPDFGGYWESGWSYSNKMDTTTGGFANLYSAFAGTGYDNSTTYAVGNFAPVIHLTPEAMGKVVSGFFITNTTIAGISMRDGDAFAKKFGGPDGNDPDWYKITVRSYHDGSLSPDSVDFYLADFRFMDNDSDYILRTWQWVDLTSLGNSDSLQIFMSSSDTGDFGMNTPAFFCIDNFTTADYELFAPPAEQPGSTAIKSDSMIFVEWANGIDLIRGYQDASDHSLGLASAGDGSVALGAAAANSAVSLGDGGTATLTFENPITNGDGWDFAVFENSFSDEFLELAFVEVSSDGVNFFRFPATSNTQTTVQTDGFGSTDARNINNLAGKYRALFGTPFDLEELVSEPGLDISTITHVRLVDVVGSILPDYATYDQNGNIVNDPWPTPFASSGFDLDAVGVIHAFFSSTKNLASSAPFMVYPNPAKESVYITPLQSADMALSKIVLTDFTGRIIRAEYGDGKNAKHEFALDGIPSGVYFISITTSKGILTNKLFVQ